MDLVLREAGTDRHTCPHSHTQSTRRDLLGQKALLSQHNSESKRRRSVGCLLTIKFCVDCQVLDRLLSCLVFE